MLVAEHLAVGELAAVIEAGVVLAVHDDVVMQTDDRADDAEVRLKARREGHDGVLAQELRQLVLQLQMELQRPVEKAGAGAAGAERPVGLYARLDHG